MVSSVEKKWSRYLFLGENSFSKTALSTDMHTYCQDFLVINVGTSEYIFKHTQKPMGYKNFCIELYLLFIPVKVFPDSAWFKIWSHLCEMLKKKQKNMHFPFRFLHFGFQGKCIKQTKITRWLRINVNMDLCGFSEAWGGKVCALRPIIIIHIIIHPLIFMLWEIWMQEQMSVNETNADCK